MPLASALVDAGVSVSLQNAKGQTALGESLCAPLLAQYTYTHIYAPCAMCLVLSHTRAFLPLPARRARSQTSRAQSIFRTNKTSSSCLSAPPT